MFGRDLSTIYRPRVTEEAPVKQAAMVPSVSDARASHDIENLVPMVGDGNGKVRDGATVT